VSHSTVLALLWCAVACVSAAQERVPAPTRPCSLAGLAAGSSSSTRPASPAELLAAYNAQAHALRTLVAAASAREPNRHGRALPMFVLAKRPYWVRMMAHAPVAGKTLFDSTSDGQQLRLFLPRQGRFYIGPLDAPVEINAPYDHIRPQHVFTAMLWPEVSSDAVQLVEKSSGAKELTVSSRGDSVPSLRIEFDPARAVVSRLSLMVGESPLETIRYDDWQPTEASASGSSMCVPRHLWIERPADNLQLELRLSRIVVNEDLPAARFRLDPPVGIPVVRLGQAGAK
jgi:hypothetical protein